MPTFGYTTIGGTYPGGAGLGPSIGACLFALSEQASVTKLTYYTDDNLVPNEHFKGVIYSDNAGTPNLLLGTTTSTLINSSTPQWWDFNFSAAVILSPGNYWLGWVTDGTASYAFDVGSAGQLKDKQDPSPNSYYDSPPSSFPSSVTDSSARKISIYATYNSVSSFNIALI